jgi:hypothetical protein
MNCTRDLSSSKRAHSDLANFHLFVHFRYAFLRDFSFSLCKFWVEKHWPRPTFVYVDNNHAEAMVYRDLESW